MLLFFGWIRVSTRALGLSSNSMWYVSLYWRTLYQGAGAFSGVGCGILVWVWVGGVGRLAWNEQTNEMHYMSLRNKERMDVVFDFLVMGFMTWRNSDVSVNGAFKARHCETLLRDEAEFKAKARGDEKLGG